MKSRVRYHVIIFFVNFINVVLLPSAYSVEKEIILKKIEKLSFEEKNDLTNLFRFCFHSSAFGYTIFGEKPMSFDAIDLLRPPFENIDSTDKWVLWEYKKTEGWDVWKKHFQDIPLEGFSFISYPVFNQTEFFHVAIINHKLFLKMVEKHLSDFQKVLNRKMQPIEILKEYIKCEGIFEIIRNHDGLLGILLGYGKENAWKYMQGEKLFFSVDIEFAKQCDNMAYVLPPLFMVVKGSEETEQIMSSSDKQRAKIDQLYQKENFLEIVMLKLFCSETTEE